MKVGDRVASTVRASLIPFGIRGTIVKESRYAEEHGRDIANVRWDSAASGYCLVFDSEIRPLDAIELLGEIAP